MCEENREEELVVISREDLDSVDPCLPPEVLAKLWVRRRVRLARKVVRRLRKQGVAIPRGRGLPFLLACVDQFHYSKGISLEAMERAIRQVHEVYNDNDQRTKRHRDHSGVYERDQANIRLARKAVRRLRKKGVAIPRSRGLPFLLACVAAVGDCQESGLQGR
jgi:ribosomal protein S25